MSRQEEITNCKVGLAILLFSGVYASIGLFAIVTHKATEIFPFFSFKLYSKIPQNFVHYDLILNEDIDHPQLLLHGNSYLNSIEKKALARFLRHKRAESNGATIQLDEVVWNGYSGKLVLLEGNYLSYLQDGSMSVIPFRKTVEDEKSY